MIEVFKQVAENKLSLKDSVLIKNEFKSIVDYRFSALIPQMAVKLKYTNALVKKELCEGNG